MKRLALALLLLCFGTLVADAATRFAVCTTTCTWDASDTSMWSTTSGGVTGASVPVAGDTVTFNASTCVGGTTCTTTVNTTVNAAIINFSACTASTTGCILDFSVNNNAVNLTSNWNNSGSGTRTVKMGSGIWTLTGFTGWDQGTITNLTFNAGTSTLAFSGNTSSGRTVNWGNVTYATVSFNANTSGGVMTLSGSPTIGTLNITGPNYAIMGGPSTTTITTAFNTTATSSTPITIQSSSTSNVATISAGGAFSTNWTSYWLITRTGAGTLTANNGFDLTQNTGITFATGGGACIIGGWLLWRDFDPAQLNDNFPAWLDKAA